MSQTTWNVSNLTPTKSTPLAASPVIVKGDHPIKVLCLNGLRHISSLHDKSFFILYTLPCT